MKKLAMARALWVAGTVLVQLSMLCFHARGAANNNFASAEVISGATGMTTGDNIGATKEAGEPNHAGNVGGSSVWYRWTAVGNGQFSFNTAGSAFDTLLAVYTGASVNALTPVASNDDSNTNLTSNVSIQAVNGTTYYVAVDGFDGESGALVLNWGPEVPPINDDFADATLITGPNGTTNGNSSGATQESGEPNHAGQVGGRSVWFRWTAPTSGQYVFNTAGSPFDTLLAVYTGVSVNAVSLVASNDQAGTLLTSAVSFSATSGTTYHIAVDGYGGQLGPLTLNWALEVAPANDNFANAAQLVGASGSVGGNNSGATKEPGEPNHAGNPGGRSVWFRWTASLGGEYSFNTAGSALNTLLAVYTGASVNALNLVASNDNSDFDFTSQLHFPAVAGTTYYVAVDGSAAQAGALVLNWTPFNDPTLIFTTLHHFTNGINDGSSPQSGLLLVGDALYGTTPSGGSGAGVVFRINTDGTSYTNVHRFNFSGGANPYSELILSGSTLYGTTYGGGSNYGIVFAVNTNGTGFTNLHSFPSTAGAASTNSQGANPMAGLLLVGNTLYGTARFGGTAGNGTVFAIKTDGSGFTNLHNFTATSGPASTNSDGTIPSASLVLSGNTLYGSASSGGGLGYGTIFAMNTNGTGFTVLHTFDWTGGAYPGALMVTGNTLYGTANSGGPFGWGSVFSLKTNGTGFTTVHSFNDSIGGANPRAALILRDDTLYGTTLGGGIEHKGTLFAVKTNGTDFLRLHAFTSTSGLASTNSDGANPRGGLVLSGNTLYGTAEHGGSAGEGTVFSLSLLPLPRLTIFPSGANVVLMWPTNPANFILQSTTNLVSPSVWSAVSPPPAVVNGQNAVTNAASGPRKFYRLSQ